MTRKLHVGITSFGYPPIRHVSGTRASRMAWELVARGHQVSVVTVDWRANEDGPQNDRGVTVFRTDPRHWFPAFNPNQRPFVLEGEPRLAVIRRARTALRTLRYGPFAPWARDGLNNLLARHRLLPVDAVWAIHGDDSAHEIAYRFHRATGVPWVADFKDPWDQFHPRGLRLLQRLATERRLRTAARITCTAREQADRDERTFGRPIDVIWTSYDHKSLAAARPERASQAFSILYLGHFGEKHDLAALIDVLRAVREGARSVPVEFHVFGHVSEMLRRPMHEAGIASMLVAHSFVPQERAHALMRGADALVLLPATNHALGVAVGVKELEYFASGSPVISIGPVLPEMQAIVGSLATVVQAPNVNVAAAALLDEIDAFASGRPSLRRGSVNPDALLAHTWSAKAEALERILLDLC